MGIGSIISLIVRTKDIKYKIFEFQTLAFVRDQHVPAVSYTDRSIFQQKTSQLGQGLFFFRFDGQNARWVFILIIPCPMGLISI